MKNDKIQFLIVLLLIIILFLIVTPLMLISETKKNTAMKHYQKAVKYYIKRDYQHATEEFLKSLELDPHNKNSKQYMHKAQEKYNKSLNLFYQGITSFQNKNYKQAIQKFEKSLLLNPLDKRALYYLKLCRIPEIKIKSNYPVFKTSQKDNMFLVKINYEHTLSDWIKQWKIIIKDKDNKKIKELHAEGTSPDQIEWNLRDSNNTIVKQGEYLYYLQGTSLYNRTISTKTNHIKIINDLKEIAKNKQKIAHDLNTKKGEKEIKFNVASTLLFDYNSSILREEVKQILLPLVEFLHKNRNYKIMLSGHTDNIGSKHYNYKLSRTRAYSVKKFLSKHSISKQRIKSTGYGEKRPIASNKTEKGREKNRRVEFKLIKTDRIK